MSVCSNTSYTTTLAVKIFRILFPGTFTTPRLYLAESDIQINHFKYSIISNRKQDWIKKIFANILSAPKVNVSFIFFSYHIFQKLSHNVNLNVLVISSA